MKKIILAGLLLALTLQTQSAVFIDWGTSRLPSVHFPFQGNSTVPKLPYEGFVKNNSGQFLAAGLSHHWVITAGHVAPSVGNYFLSLDGKLRYNIIEKRNLYFTNAAGTKINADISILKVDKDLPYFYKLANNVPQTGTEAISVGAGSLNLPSNERVKVLTFDFDKKTWQTNATSVVSRGWGTNDNKVRWYRSRFMEFKHYLPANRYNIYSTNDMNIYGRTFGGILMVDKKGAGYGIAGIGDSGSPTFVLENKEWRYIMPIISSVPKVAVNNSLSLGNLVFAVRSQIEDAIRDDKSDYEY